MKYFHSIILTGFIVHFLPLSAEDALTENIPLLIAENEESALTSLDDELFLLDEEFAEFDGAFSSLEEPVQEVSPIAEAPSLSIELQQEPVVAVEQETPVLELQEEKIAVLEPLLESDEKVADLEPPVAPLESLPLFEEKIAAFEIPVQPIHNVASEQTAALENPIVTDVPVVLELQENPVVAKVAPSETTSEGITVDLQQAFAGSPIIYLLLFAMSVVSVCIWLYSVIAVGSSARVSEPFLKNVQNKLNTNNFEEVLLLCEEKKGLFSKMLASGIYSRRHGLPVMIEAMKAEGKRSTISFWQKIGLLNDIAIIAPMLGLLGTVLGMFYAFYDVNRSMESISTLFDGLGISVGTTVAGLVVAILSLILHSTAKYRLVRALALVENQAQNVAVLIDDRTSIHRG